MKDCLSSYQTGHIQRKDTDTHWCKAKNGNIIGKLSEMGYQRGVRNMAEKKFYYNEKQSENNLGKVGIKIHMVGSFAY